MTIVIEGKTTAAAVIEAETSAVTKLMASGEPASTDGGWFCKV
ncbi:hypothetical protein [Neorhizobium galegae]|nr:hypothetical protein [Neorhizobium galegae]